MVGRARRQVVAGEGVGGACRGGVLYGDVAVYPQAVAVVFVSAVLFAAFCLAVAGGVPVVAEGNAVSVRAFDADVEAARGVQRVFAQQAQVLAAVAAEVEGGVVGDLFKVEPGVLLERGEVVGGAVLQGLCEGRVVQRARFFDEGGDFVGVVAGDAGIVQRARVFAPDGECRAFQAFAVHRVRVVFFVPDAEVPVAQDEAAVVVAVGRVAHALFGDGVEVARVVVQHVKAGVE